MDRNMRARLDLRSGQAAFTAFAAAKNEGVDVFRREGIEVVRCRDCTTNGMSLSVTPSD
jgi:hypothetical protein